MSTKKTCKRVIFYCKGKPESFKYEGKEVYASWPKLLHTDPSTAISWADGYWHKKTPHFTVEMDNKFNDAIVLDEVSVRGQSSKVPQALVYDLWDDCYLMFDFRSDGLVETICNKSIVNSVIKCGMSFRFNGGNYYFVPTTGKSFAEYEKAFNQTNSPKTSSTTKIDVGVPFQGNYNNYYVYLGEFQCTKDECENVGNVASYEGETVNVYLQVAQYCEYYKAFEVEQHPFSASLTISKSKMKVKKVVDKNDPNYNSTMSYYDQVKAFNNGNIKTTNFDKANYGSYGVYAELDVNGTEVTFTKESPVSSNNCGSDPYGMNSFGDMIKKFF